MSAQNPMPSGSAEQQAHSWVSQFAPLVLEEESTLTESEVRSQIELVERLKKSGPEIAGRLEQDPLANSELTTTFHSAMSQLETVEDDIRKKLGKLAPGDPAGIADLERLNEKLAERAARDELGIESTTTDGKFHSLVSNGNFAVAGFMGIFGIGWTAFTLVHAVLMIGGMYSAFGPLALLLLGFYAIFFFVGFGMLAGAVSAASKESVEISGDELTIVKEFGPWLRRRQYHLAPNAEASVGTPSFGFVNQSKGKSQAIQITDSEGKSVSFGSNADANWREKLVNRVNSYLKMNGTRV